MSQFFLFLFIFLFSFFLFAKTGDKESRIWIKKEKIDEHEEREQQKVNETKKIGKLFIDYIRLYNTMETVPNWEFKERGKTQDLVVEKIMGYGKGKVLLKNWLVNRGMGKMRVNKMFRRSVYEAHQDSSLPQATKIKQQKFGPRRSSLGHGVLH